MLESPFASGAIAAQLVQQLSQSLALSQSDLRQGSGTMRAEEHVQHGSRQQAQAQRQQQQQKPGGVASILESPFSSCLSAELRQLDVDAPLDKLPAEGELAPAGEPSG
jgi:hypothetical protein